jgi:magnesium transporter
MIRYYTKHSPTEQFQQISVPPPEGGTWVYAEHPTDSELEALIDRYDLDPNIISDLHDRDELPRVEFSGNALYIFLRSTGRNKHGEVLTAPLLSIITADTFLTLNSENTLAAEKIMSSASHAGIRTTDAPALVISTLAAIVTDYEELIHRTGRYIKDTGHRLRTHEVDNSDFVHFVTIEDNLNQFEQNLTEMVAVAESLKENKHYELSVRDREALNDTVLHMNQLITGVKSLALTIASIRNAYSTIADNNLNRRMKTLTVFTVLIALPNVFYGMYGMNVPLPFQQEPWSYTIIVLFTIVLIFGVYAIAKRFRVF